MEKNDKEVEEHAAINSSTVYHAILKEGEEELARPTSALFWSGLAAGLSMGFSPIMEALISSHLPPTEWRPLLSKFGYCAGFLIVILGRQQLFTENTLTPVLPLLKNPRAASALNVLRLWTIVLAANLAGAAVMAFVMIKSSVFEQDTKQEIVRLGLDALAPGALTIGIKAVFAGWLIALLIWLLPFAESARTLVIIFITYLIGIGHFSHSIAGSIDVFAGAVDGASGWGQAVMTFLMPALAGNIIGGVILVAALNHAQVTSGE